MAGTSEAVETVKISPDGLAQKARAIFKKAKEDFIENKGKDALAELVDDQALDEFLVNPANYPPYPEITENAVLTYINFIFDISVNEAARKAPPELMKGGILHTLESYNLSKIRYPDLHLRKYFILMRRCLGNYLDEAVYENKDEHTIATLQRGI